jgi:hypothetical protein
LHGVKLQIILIGTANKTPEQTIAIKWVVLKNGVHKTIPYSWVIPKEILQQKKQAAIPEALVGTIE